MPTTTTNYSLEKPLVNNATDQDLWGGYLNDDMDDIDGLLRAGITIASQSVQTTGFTADASISVKKIYPCDATGGSFAATLPSASAAGNGSCVYFKKIDNTANIITITGSIDGASNFPMNSQYQCIGFVSDGTSSWQVLSQSQSSSVRVIESIDFTSSGTYTPTTGTLYCLLECWGAGGGGAGSNVNVGAGGGGGAGGYSKIYVPIATIGASQVITIGAAGTAGASGNGTGGTGGTTSIGSIIQATGGVGGVATNGSTAASGGAGGVGSGGDTNGTGNPGGVGMWGVNIGNAFGGIGATTSLGGAGAPGALAPNAGNAAAANSGSGGGGACSNGTPQAGGAGGSGYVAITEFRSQ